MSYVYVYIHVRTLQGNYQRGHCQSRFCIYTSRELKSHSIYRLNNQRNELEASYVLHKYSTSNLYPKEDNMVRIHNLIGNILKHSLAEDTLRNDLMIICIALSACGRHSNRAILYSEREYCTHMCYMYTYYLKEYYIFLRELSKF